jgi:hypothetical protein
VRVVLLKLGLGLERDLFACECGRDIVRRVKAMLGLTFGGGWVEVKGRSDWEERW